jgi:hypothetical protein
MVYVQGNRHRLIAYAIALGIGLALAWWLS